MNKSFKAVLFDILSTSRLGIFILLLFLSSLSVIYTQRNFEIKTALEKEEEFLKNDVDRLLALSSSFEQIASEYNSQFCRTVGKRVLGCYLVRKGNPKKGIKLLLEAKRSFTASRDEYQLVKTYNELGIAYFLQGDLTTAEEFYLASLRIGNTTNFPDLAILSEINLAKLYLAKNKKDLAKMLILHYIKQSKEMGKWEATSNGYGVLIDFYLNENNLKEAKRTIVLQKEYAIRSKSENQYINALTNEGILAYFNNDFFTCEAKFKEVLEHRKSVGANYKTYEAYYNLAGLYEGKNLTTFYLYLDSCIQFAMENKLYQLQKEALEWKWNVSKETSIQNEIRKVTQQVKQLEIENQNEANQISRELHVKKANVGHVYFPDWIFYGVLFVFGVLWLTYKR